MKFKIALLILLALILIAPRVFGHCDWVKGPVVEAARVALEKRDVTPVLAWTVADQEREVRSAFDRTLAARAAGGAAREIADQWFFETVVRLHRAAEGEVFTGLKGAEYQPEPGMLLADQVLEGSSFEKLEATLTAGVRAGLQQRYHAVIEAKKHAGDNVAAGRKFVRAYADFVHYVDGVHRTAGAVPEEHHGHH